MQINLSESVIRCHVKPNLEWQYARYQVWFFFCFSRINAFAKTFFLFFCLSAINGYLYFGQQTIAKYFGHKKSDKPQR